MRRLAPLLALALVLAACGGSSGAPKNAMKVTFGVQGGLVIPYAITIAPTGKVSSTGHPAVKPTALSTAEVERISGLVRDQIGKLKSLQCARTSPDVATLFITAKGTTVGVHGTCEPAFTKLYSELTGAVKINN